MSNRGNPGDLAEWHFEAMQNNSSGHLHGVGGQYDHDQLLRLAGLRCFFFFRKIPWPLKTISLQPRWLEGRLLHIVQLRDLRLSTRHHHRHPSQDIYALEKVADALILREVFVQCQNGENGGRKYFPNYESLEQRGLIKTFSNLSHLCIKDSTFLIWFLLVSWGTSSNSHIPL